MIRRFETKSKVLQIPARWLNSVANALNNIRSPRQTIEARLEGDGEGSNLSLDIRPQSAASVIAPHLAAEFPRKNDNSLLGEGLKWGERGLAIDKEWLKRAIVSP